jgi:hypothetical protein
MKCLLILLVAVSHGLTVSGSEIFRSTDILDPRSLGGDFTCEDVSTKDRGIRFNPLVDNFGSEKFNLCGQYAKDGNVIHASSYTIGIVNNLQFNSQLARHPVRFAAYTFNRHKADKQHTVSFNLFDNNDDSIVPDFRLEYAFGNYSLSKLKKRQQLQRIQWFGRIERFGKDNTAYDLGVRFFIPNLVRHSLSTEVDLWHRIGPRKARKNRSNTYLLSKRP